MFDLQSNDRLIEWRRFRDSLETASNPLQENATFWAKTPFVSNYLNPHNPNSWPDPWHLVIDNRYDELAIALGFVYTLKLTERFMDHKFEIHMSMLATSKNPDYFCCTENQDVFDVASRRILLRNEFVEKNTSLIWQTAVSK